ncbi:VOC family protein, partial [Thermodesulfobacteriota bacterium]
YKVEIAFITVGDVWLEFISPTEDEPKFTPFLKKNGPGLHHIAYVVEDIQKAMNTIKVSGVEPENDEPLKGADGLICFISPDKLGGVYTELVQPK